MYGFVQRDFVRPNWFDRLRCNWSHIFVTVSSGLYLKSCLVFGNSLFDLFTCKVDFMHGLQRDREILNLALAPVNCIFKLFAEKLRVNDFVTPWFCKAKHGLR